MGRRAAQGNWLLHQMVKQLCLGSSLNCPASLHAASSYPAHSPSTGRMKVCPYVKPLVVTFTQKIEVTHNNDTLSSRALSQHCKALQERYKPSGWKWDTELTTLKAQLLLKAATNYQFLFFTCVLPIIFEKLCQILLSLVYLLVTNNKMLQISFPSGNHRSDSVASQHYRAE